MARSRTRVRYANRLKADLQTVSDELESTQAQSTHVQSRAKLKASHLSESLGARSHPTSAPGLRGVEARLSSAARRALVCLFVCLRPAGDSYALRDGSSHPLMTSGWAEPSENHGGSLSALGASSDIAKSDRPEKGSDFDSRYWALH